MPNDLLNIHDEIKLGYTPWDSLEDLLFGKLGHEGRLGWTRKQAAAILYFSWKEGHGAAKTVADMLDIDLNIITPDEAQAQIDKMVHDKILKTDPKEWKKEYRCNKTAELFKKYERKVMGEDVKLTEQQKRDLKKLYENHPLVFSAGKQGEYESLAEAVRDSHGQPRKPQKKNTLPPANRCFNQYKKLKKEDRLRFIEDLYRNLTDKEKKILLARLIIDIKPSGAMVQNCLDDSIAIDEFIDMLN